MRQALVTRNWLVAPALCAALMLSVACTQSTVIDQSQTTNTVVVQEPTPSTASADEQTDAAPSSEEAASSQADFEFMVDSAIADATLGKDGGAVVFARRGDTEYETAMGWADNQGAFLDTTTPMRLGSISKLLMATMVMQMVDEELVDLDLMLAHYLPDTTHGAEVSVREILGHRSGIPSYTDNPSFIDDLRDEPDRVWSAQEILDTVDPSPGSTGRFRYSNTNYILIGQLVEVVDGRALHLSLDDRINDRLGTAFVLPGPEVAAPAATPSVWTDGVYDGDPSPNFVSVESAAWAAGAVIGTASDLATFADALLAGELMSESAFAQMQPGGSEPYGLGLAAIPMGANAPGLGHGGAIDGFASVVAINPGTNDLVIVLTNDDKIVNNDIALNIVVSW